jgi:hypothetical protein
MKLFELIRASYQTHKSLLNSSETDRFGQLLATTLDSLKSVLNLVSFQDISKHLEETLTYLKSTFNIDKIKTIQCTQEVIANIIVAIDNHFLLYLAFTKSSSISCQFTNTHRNQTT